MTRSSRARPAMRRASATLAAARAHATDAEVRDPLARAATLVERAQARHLALARGDGPPPLPFRAERVTVIRARGPPRRTRRTGSRGPRAARQALVLRPRLTGALAAVLALLALLAAHPLGPTSVGHPLERPRAERSPRAARRAVRSAQVNVRARRVSPSPFHERALKRAPISAAPARLSRPSKKPIACSDAASSASGPMR